MWLPNLLLTSMSQRSINYFLWNMIIPICSTNSTFNHLWSNQIIYMLQLELKIEDNYDNSYWLLQCRQSYPLFLETKNKYFIIKLIPTTTII